MQLKPNRWYWYDNREPFVAGLIVLHDFATDRDGFSQNYSSLLRTDANGEIVQFKQMGELSSFSPQL
jgi:hypothetical protein